MSTNTNTIDRAAKLAVITEAEGNRLMAEHAALVTVAEAAEAFQNAADDMDISYGTSDFLPGNKSREYFDRLAKLKTALAAVRQTR